MDPKALKEATNTGKKQQKQSPPKMSATNVTALNAQLIEQLRTGLAKMSLSDAEALYNKARDAYYNTSEALLEDGEFDALKARIVALDPKNKLVAAIGAPVREGDERKVTLPYWMGSLDKIRDDAKAVEKWKVGYAEPATYVVSDKLDGNSAMVVRERDGTVRLFSRGDGTVGQDCSKLVSLVKGMVSAVKGTETFAVRGEVIMSRASWNIVKAKGGANARNVTAGIMNAKTPDVDVARRCEFVAYELLSPKMAPAEGLAWLKKAGFIVVHHGVWTAAELTMQTLSDELVARRTQSPYEVDGIVIMHNSDKHKAVKGKNPKWGFAFKSMITHEEAEVIVTDVEWNVSKHGYLKPTVIFEPVALNGVTIRRATGFNAGFIEKNAIGVGTRVALTRSGDVIPYITRVITGTRAAMPPGEWSWVEGATHGVRVDIQVKAGVDGAMAPDQAVRVLEHFTSTLDVKYVARGTLEKLVAAGVTDVVSLLRLDEAKLKGIDGIGPKNAVKIAESLKLLRDSNVPCARWMAASNLFGRGFGEKRLAAIVAKYPEVALGNDLSAAVIKGISEIEGVGPKTAKQFVEALPAFQKAWKGWNVKCGEMGVGAAVGVAAAAPVAQRFAGQVIVFTGVRNKELEAAIVAAGGEVSTTVGKKTTLVVAKDPEENSGKIKKAREMGIRIVGMAEFEVYNLLKHG